MKSGDIFNLTRGTRVILAITLTVSFLAVVFAYFYYRGLNRSEDPRVLPARNILLEYDRISGTLNLNDKFRLLDSASAIFNSLSDYRGSFESGVILNNRAGSLLISAIYDSTMTSDEKRKCLELAINYCDSGILCYNAWKREWGSLKPDEILMKLRPLVNKDDPAFSDIKFEKILERRARNISMAQIETDRRLSVSFTNRGTILRHLQKQDSALYYYNRALALWSDNRTAKSNLSVLMGGEALKPSLIETLFPPDKNKR